MRLEFARHDVSDSHRRVFLCEVEDLIPEPLLCGDPGACSRFCFRRLDWG
jgi:hypothetical protein